MSDLVREEFGFAAGAPYRPAAYRSSLHAVAAAASALQAGDLDLAIAGGAQLGIDPAWLALQARAGTLGTDEMRVYSADPAGLLPGEGCGIVVLVRSADARAAGVPVYAEIAGWSITPVMASRSGAASLQAYEQAGIDPADVQLIEGHGTGTAAGDSAELAALARLRHGGRAVAALGAVSASVGYTKAAAGIASLVKTAVAMVAGTIPPGTGCTRPHPLIASGDTLLRLPAQPEVWPDGIRLAAVNSLGPAGPAVCAPGFPGFQDAEGVHLILRREGETDRWPGRRRRDTEGAAVQPAAPAEATRPSTRPGRSAAEPPGKAADQANIFAFCDADCGALAHRLGVIGASAAALSGAELHELARQLALGAHRAAVGPAVPVTGPPGTGLLRVALAAAAPAQLAAQAQYAARLLRTNRPMTVPTATTPPGVHMSAGATGTVVVLFPGRADSAAAHPALLAVSLEALATLEVLGVKPAAGVGYGLAEITGLAWAGSLPAAEAARLVAQCGQVLRASSGGPAAMARITAPAGLTRTLSAPGRLHVAAYEGPRTHVLAGSTGGIRELARRGGALGVPVEILGGTSAMHSPAMTGCVAPLRSVLAGTRAGPPQRRLISTISGRLITAHDDIADLLARQVSLPVLFAQAMAQAARGADLIVVAGPDAGLATAATECCGVPAVALPRLGRSGAERAASVQAVAALFTAGAITDLMPFLTTSVSPDTLASRTVPRMRAPEPDGHEDVAADRRTTVRSAQ